MGLELLEHYTIRCKDLEATRAFYSEVLGLVVGPRPAFPFPGYWIYCGERAVVHLAEDNEGVTVPDRAANQEAGTGGLDHIAFRATDLDGVRANLRRHDVPFREAEVPGGQLHQVFVYDPNKIMLELNFWKT